jgi:hypothetical protein
VREADESPLLKAAARERLLKTLQAEKDLTRSDLRIVEISDSAVIGFEWCV